MNELEKMDHYQVLGLFSTEIDCTNITEAEIKKAYRKKALELHPDKNNCNDAASFQQLQASYSVLTDKELREKFDHEWRLKRRQKARKEEETNHVEEELKKKEKCFDYKAWKEEMIERRRYERVIFEYESRMEKEEKEKKEREFWKMRVMIVRWDKDDNGDFNEYRIREIFEYFGGVEDVMMLEKKRNNTCVALVVMASMESMVAAVAAKWEHPRPRFVVRLMYSNPVTGHM